MDNKKLFGAIIGVIAFIAVIAGATYAWFTWTSSPTTVGGTTGCFDIVYAKGTDISGSLVPSSSYTGGKSTSVTINIDPKCTITGKATLKLTTNATDDATAIPLTAGAVKWAVYKSGTTDAVATGTVTATGTIDLAQVDLTTTATTYDFYVWLDGTIADNTYVGKTYSGSISATATQNAS